MNKNKFEFFLRRVSIVSIVWSFLTFGFLFPMQKGADAQLQKAIIASRFESYLQDFRIGRLVLSDVSTDDLTQGLSYIDCLAEGQQASFGGLYAAFFTERERRALFSAINRLLSELKSDKEWSALDADKISSLERNINEYRELSGESEVFSSALDKINALRGQEKSDMRYVIPLDQLQKLGLCPLYPRTISALIEKQAITSTLPVLYHAQKTWNRIFIPEKNVAVLPCVQHAASSSVKMGADGNARAILQLKTVNQEEFGDLPGACPSLSLYNCLQVWRYAVSGVENLLRDLYNHQKATQFVKTQGCAKWVTQRELALFISQARFDMPAQDITVLGTLLALDPRYQGLYVEESELPAFKERLANIRAGMLTPYFVHTFIVGNDELSQAGKAFGHYHAVVVIKAGNQIQYIILDSVASNYYLHPDSYELQQMYYFIELLESGSSLIIDLEKDTPLRLHGLSTEPESTLSATAAAASTPQVPVITKSPAVIAPSDSPEFRALQFLKGVASDAVEINLREQNLSRIDGDLLQELNRFTKLDRLLLGSNKFIEVPDLSVLSSLTTLGLVNNDIKQVNLNHLPTSLKFLNIVDNPLSPSEKSRLSDVAKERNIVIRVD